MNQIETQQKHISEPKHFFDWLKEISIQCSLAFVLLVGLSNLPAHTSVVEAAESDGNIVGGRPAEEGEVPWQAHLDIYKNGNVYLCGGILIAENWILTAAHCIQTNSGDTALPEDITVTLGDLNSNQTEPQEQVVLVNQVIMHPDYDSQSHDADIALLAVSPAEITHAVAPVELGSIADEATNAAVQLSGYGRVAEDGNLSDLLLVAETSLILPEQCDVAYGGQGRVTENMICAGSLERTIDTCDGDSGGPLIVPSHEMSILQGTIPMTETIPAKLVGITSWGKGCARPGIPGVYTRVSKYTEWIKAIINKPYKAYLSLIRVR
mgnify:CR=1 FL=1